MVAAALYVTVFFLLCKQSAGLLLDDDLPPSASQWYQQQCNARLQLAKTCNPPLPRTYIATRKSDTDLNVDGRLDDAAWNDVPWSENFVDIRGTSFPSPRLETRVKVIYDDTHIYVASRLTEPQVWATYTQKDSSIYQENAFEIFFDVDNSMSWYKEYEINALGTTWDLSLNRPYIDGGDPFEWVGIGEKGVYTDGGVNDINNPSTFWSTEVSFPFTALNENTTRSRTTPVDGEVWFSIFARAEYELRENQASGRYEQVPGSGASWWTWNPIGATNIHLPNRWGLLYFTNQTAQQMDNDQFQVSFPRWPIYYGLFHIFDAMQAFKALNNLFVTDERQVHFDPFIHDCFTTVEVNLTDDGFEAKLASSRFPHGVGHINQNRTIWFTDS